MNFDMQDLVGKWCLATFKGRELLCKVSHIDFTGSKFNYANSWTPTYPLKLKTPVKIGDHIGWSNLPMVAYLHDVTVLEPEMADIYIQANNIKLPERN